MKGALNTLIFLITTLVVAGCASTVANLVPGPKVQVDPFDGKTQIHQDDVNAAKFGEPMLTLGFYWKESHPDTVVVEPGVPGIHNISDVSFNADGTVLEGLAPIASGTEYGDWSTRAFAMPIDEFRQIATAQSVKMKVSDHSTYQVSTFGQAHTSVTVSSKIKTFMEMVEQRIQ